MSNNHMVVREGQNKHWASQNCEIKYYSGCVVDELKFTTASTKFATQTNYFKPVPNAQSTLKYHLLHHKTLCENRTDQNLQ